MGARVADVRVVDGVITEVGVGLAASPGATVLDAEGCVTAPGLVDLQVHFREPGREDAETLETGARAAALGGCTAVVCMPNTDPPLDDAAVVQAVLERGRRGACDVRVAGCITKGRRGEELAPLGELYDLGVRIFTDDGDCVADALVMRRVFEYASRFPTRCSRSTPRIPRSFGAGTCTRASGRRVLGIPGRPAEAESSIVARDLALAKLTGGRYHVLHLSTAQAAVLVRAAKADGVRVTAECTPQHLVLTDAECAVVRPGVQDEPTAARTIRRRRAARRRSLDGTIDAIATDHAPHAPETKEVPFEEAPPGMLGVETALAVALTTLVEPGVLTLAQLLAAMSWKPARICGVDRDGHGGPIVPGAAAHLCVIDLARQWVVDAARLASRSANSPWDGWKLTGKVRHTVLAGVPTVRDGEAQ